MARPKASQPQYTSSKKRPRAVSASASAPDEDAEQEEEEEADVEAGKGKGGKKDVSEETMRLIGMDIVRLAIFHESKKIGLSKKDIQQKILSEKHKVSNRLWPQALEIAQKVLRKTFGMELVVLRKAGKAGEADDDEDAGGPAKKKKGKGKGRAGDEDEEEEEAEDGKGKKKAMAPGTASDTYILRSLLPANLLAYALDPDKQAVLRLGGNGSGAIVDFEVGDDPKLMGVLWLILALIFISGRELEENQLKIQLRRLSLYPTTPLPTSHPTHHTPPLLLDPFLAKLKSQKYLESSKPAAATQAEGAPVPVMWKWGARSEQEIGEKEVTEMIGEMVVPDEEGGDEEEWGRGDGEGGEGRREGRERERKREKKRERVRRDVAGAAGLGVGGKLKER